MTRQQAEAMIAKLNDAYDSDYEGYAYDALIEAGIRSNRAATMATVLAWCGGEGAADFLVEPNRRTAKQALDGMGIDADILHELLAEVAALFGS